VTAARCSATARTGDQCGKPAIPGGATCRVHGGAAPQVVAAAARRIATAAVRAEAEALLGQLGLEPVDDPVSEIGRLAAAALATYEAAAARVNALDGIRFTDAKGSEQLRAEVAVMERAMDRAGRLLDMQAKHQAQREGDPDGAVERAVAGLIALGDSARARNEAA